MEEILKLILNKLDSLEQGQEKLTKKIDNIERGQEIIKSDIVTLKEGQNQLLKLHFDLEKKVDNRFNQVVEMIDSNHTVVDNALKTFEDTQQEVFLLSDQQKRLANFVNFTG